jgi:succinate dehydrogenase flavin-adding protein (antitoxin of CptAB toxin-antitoxin module)
MKTTQKRQKRKHNAIYRARRGGSEVDTLHGSIYRAFSADVTLTKAEKILVNEFQFGVQLLITN